MINNFINNFLGNLPKMTKKLILNWKNIYLKFNQMQKEPTIVLKLQSYSYDKKTIISFAIITLGSLFKLVKSSMRRFP